MNEEYVNGVKTGINVYTQLLLDNNEVITQIINAAYEQGFRAGIRAQHIEQEQQGYTVEQMNEMSKLTPAQQQEIDAERAEIERDRIEREKAQAQVPAQSQGMFSRSKK